VHGASIELHRIPHRHVGQRSFRGFAVAKRSRQCGQFAVWLAVAHYRPCRAGGPAATNPDHAAKARLVLKHQPYPTTTYVLRLDEGCQCFGEFFSTPLAPAGRSLGVLCLEPPCASHGAGRPNFCASAARIGATTNISPVVDACSQGSKKRRSSSGVSDSLRRPPWVGRTTPGSAHCPRSRACMRGTVARATHNTNAVCSSVAFSNSGNNTANAQQNSSRLLTLIASVAIT